MSPAEIEAFRMGLILGVVAGSVITGVVMAVLHRAKKQQYDGHPAYFADRRVR